MKNIFRYLIILTIIGLMTSCWKQIKPSEITDRFYGTYIFEYPSGEIEELIINEDKSYIKNIYSNEEDNVNKSKPIYSSIGSWKTSIYNDKKVDFNDWLEYCYMRYPDSILPSPTSIDMLERIWVAPNNKHKGLIYVYGPSGYIFKKTD